MRQFYGFILSILALSMGTISCGNDDDPQEETIIGPQVTVAMTDARKAITAQGISIPYHELKVSVEGKTDKPCLLLYLHGGTSTGNDNEKQMEEPGVDSISNYLKTRKVNACMLVPQCPARQSWTGPAGYVLKSLIDEYVNQGIVDAGRIYVFGGSMGGTGTWSMLATYPDLFAAAMPVAGNPEKAGEYSSSTPLLTVMGTADNLMSYETANDFVDYLKASGVDANIEIVEGWTHEMTCKQSYTTSRLDWVLSHRRN
mgnify:FL=1